MQTSKRLLHLAVAALARRDYSRAELARLLQRKLKADESLADIASALDHLGSRGLINDARVAQTFVQARASRHGRLRLEQELSRRGVSRETIRSVLPDPESEAASALALWQRRFGTVPGNLRERARQMRYLAARGYSRELAARVIARSDDDSQ